MPAEPSKEAMADLTSLIAWLDEECPHFTWTRRQCDRCLRLALDAWRDKALEDAAERLETKGDGCHDFAKARAQSYDQEQRFLLRAVAWWDAAGEVRSLRSAREEGKGEA